MKRLLSALPGMMIHQDGSTHQWVPGSYWDLIVTMLAESSVGNRLRFFSTLRITLFNDLMAFVV